ncbi:adenosine deaminase/editase [Mrakia frigida]|uniref:tRNA-specific adenosine deaminase n=1 Tax=Mrakia frigida TaxID=29902 RepID=UPI003FCBF613
MTLSTPLPPLHTLSHRLASLVIQTHLSLPSSHRPALRTNGVREWTPLAGIALSRSSPSSGQQQLLLISLGAGSKVLPTSKKSKCGDLVNDLHAEVLAARGARRWLAEEVGRCLTPPSLPSAGTPGDLWKSDWIELRARMDGNSSKWKLKEGVEMVMYVSTLPCELTPSLLLLLLLPSFRARRTSAENVLRILLLPSPGGDASTLHLAKLQETQDPAMAALKDASAPSSFVPGSLARGRDGYLNFGACRTKPGRADSPPTTSMSCSDKLASWTLLGMQGALLSTLFEPVYVSTLVVGEIEGCVESLGGKEWEEVVQAEVSRAVGGRVVEGLRASSSAGDLPPLYFPHPPTIDLTPLAFPYSKLHLSETFPDSSTTATNTSISIIGSSPERIAQTGITVVGSAVKRDAEGGPLSEKARSRISKLEMMRLVLKIRGLEGNEVSSLTYRQLKHSAEDYQQAKKVLRRGETAVFRAWVGAGEEWERFGVDGRQVDLVESQEDR